MPQIVYLTTGTRAVALSPTTLGLVARTLDWAATQLSTPFTTAKLVATAKLGPASRLRRAFVAPHLRH